MKKNLDVLVADSSGNITIMVLTPTDRSEYKSVAQSLLDDKSLGGEQVAFVMPDRMEMCGLEFCGNASRAFALYEAGRTGLFEKALQGSCSDKSRIESENDFSEITVSVSGCAHPLKARICAAELEPDIKGSLDEALHSNLNTANASIIEMDMPVPSSAQVMTAEELGANKGGLLIDMDGIFHLVLTDVAPSSELFESLKSRIYSNINPDISAFGVMFCDTVNELMTPVVYVKDVDSTYFEGSCASGSVAASYALALEMPDGTHGFTLKQPEGTLYTSVTKEKGRIEKISLKGLVTLSDVMSVDI